MNTSNMRCSVPVSTFKILVCLFVLLVLPLNMLRYIDSFLLTLSVNAIIIDTALMVVFFVTLAFLGAATAGVVSALCMLFRKKQADDRIVILFSAMGVGSAVYEFSRGFKFLLSKSFQFVFVTPVYIKIIIPVCCVALLVLFHEKAVRVLMKEADAWFKVVLVLVALAAVAVVSQIAYVRFTGGLVNTPMKVVETGKDNAAQRNIILITFDALSAEDMSLYKYKLLTTPNLTDFAQKSYVFAHMYANSNWTRPGVASILTGVYPLTHKLIYGGWDNCFLPIKMRHRNLAAVLKQYGYSTAAVVSSLTFAHPLANDTATYFDYAPLNTIDREYILDTDPLLLLWRPLTPFFLRIGSTANLRCYEFMSQYYQLLAKTVFRVRRGDKWNKQTGFPAELTFNMAYEYLRNVHAPYFLWIHVVPPHAPYLPSDEYKNKFLNEDILRIRDYQRRVIGSDYSYSGNLQPLIDKLRLRYDENILYADHEFGVFLDRLKKDGYYDRSVIVVSADHGESFEHGYAYHGGPSLYNNLIHIPLIIHLPGQRQGGQLTQAVEQIDIAPTILDLAGIDIPLWMEGETVKKTLTTHSLCAKPKFSMYIEGKVANGAMNKGTIAVLKDSFKYIYYVDKKKCELYDLSKDSKELINLAEIEKEKVAAMHALIKQKLYP